MAGAVLAGLLLSLIFAPLSLAQQRDSALPVPADGAPLSRNFAATAFRAGELLRDWQQYIAFTFENGYPFIEAEVLSDRDRAADALELAASSDADRAALEQLRNLFANLQQWTDGLVEDKRHLRLARYYMAPTGVEDDPMFQKNTRCATSISEMLSGK